MGLRSHQGQSRYAIKEDIMDNYCCPQCLGIINDYPRCQNCGWISPVEIPDKVYDHVGKILEHLTGDSVKFERVKDE